MIISERAADEERAPGRLRLDSETAALIQRQRRGVLLVHVQLDPPAAPLAGARHRRFDEIRFGLEDVVDGGEPDQVLVLLTLHTRGKGSGVEVDVRIGHVLTVREGRIARGRVYTDPDEARAAAGLT